MIRAFRPRLAALLLLVGLATIGPALSATGESALPPEGRLTYDVLRRGDRIGTQTIEFVHRDGRLVVRNHVDIKIDVLFFFTYRFRHDSEEQWVDGRLVALMSRTNDDGKKRTVELRRVGDRLRGTYNGKARDLPATLLPASLWHPETVRQSLLLDPIKGRSRRISVTDKGEERLNLPEGAVTAHRYAITGQVEREVWYGPDGRLLQMRFSAKDDSKITVILRSSSPIEGRTATAPLSSGT
jgi:hypothetical protein